ncbi:MAG: response regulator, partial [candidate division KSB1 bacterium]|nr:response regulator [candidate division KSB1 bacterium]
METLAKSKILIVDDERAARYGMRKALAILNAQIDECGDGEEALQQVTQLRPDVVLCDINMPKINGLEFLRRLREMRLDAHPAVIVVTAYGSEKVAGEAMKAGAYDYLSKPYEIDELRLIVSRALEKIRLERENIELKKRIAESKTDLLGNSQAMHHVRRLIEKAAPTDVTVLLVGASGTGKELAARTIHSLSNRADGPYVTMNCAA